MANNVSIDPGSSPSTTIATDETASGHIQLVKLVNSTEDSTTRTGLSGDPIFVDPTPASPAANDYVVVRLTDGSSYYSASGSSGGTSMVDDAAFTVGTTSITPAGGTYKSTRDSVNDGDGGCLAMTAKRGLYTTIETPNGDTAMDDTLDAVNVSIVAGSAGIETQYTEGDVDTSITGTALMWEDSSDTLRAVSAAKPLPVNVVSGGGSTLTNYHLISGASTNATSIKASSATLYSIEVFNTNASARYLKIYNKASSPSVGSDTPVMTILVPGNSTGAGVVITYATPRTLATGLAIATTTGIAVSDSTGVGSNDLAVNISYA